MLLAVEHVCVFRHGQEQGACQNDILMILKETYLYF